MTGRTKYYPAHKKSEKRPKPRKRAKEREVWGEKLVPHAYQVKEFFSFVRHNRLEINFRLIAKVHSKWTKPQLQSS